MVPGGRHAIPPCGWDARLTPPRRASSSRWRGSPPCRVGLGSPSRCRSTRRTRRSHAGPSLRTHSTPGNPSPPPPERNGATDGLIVDGPGVRVPDARLVGREVRHELGGHHDRERDKEPGRPSTCPSRPAPGRQAQPHRATRSGLPSSRRRRTAPGFTGSSVPSNRPRGGRR